MQIILTGDGIAGIVSIIWGIIQNIPHIKIYKQKHKRINYINSITQNRQVYANVDLPVNLPPKYKIKKEYNNRLTYLNEKD